MNTSNITKSVPWLSASLYGFYISYESTKCNKKLLSEFEAWENEVYDSIHDSCRDRFPNSITSCCDAAGSGGCTLSGVVQWLPDWTNDHCYEKNGKKRWSHDTLEACCSKYFSSSGACNRRDLMALKYYTPGNSDYCSAKAMSKFRALEVRFDSLDECCHTKFPQYVSDCCESSDGGCSLSGKLRFIPNWKDQICFTKDEHLLSNWERPYARTTLRRVCCGR
ncbi:hypothetical protein ACHAWO_008014 [Cyclotella atomus]|uniref:Lysozyme n=1 Tax=Cyclotella atomus TaxID=382360 RepID=A0ABD3PEJ7_9STRA